MNQLLPMVWWTSWSGHLCKLAGTLGLCFRYSDSDLNINDQGKLAVGYRWKITNHFRGIYRHYPNLIKENWRMWTCNWLDLQTLGSQPVMLKNLPDHWREREREHWRVTVEKWFGTHEGKARQGNRQPGIWFPCTQQNHAEPVTSLPIPSLTGQIATDNNNSHCKPFRSLNR